ncbi:glycosyl hydrolase family 28-related protein [Streptomyces olivochromogenes]|uniref:right-handed parallel beta-helix repeat-containing protein n=1 Tax=Streptomyces olivochromogenes TaxID=1963 RepID=UPI0036DF249F
MDIENMKAAQRINAGQAVRTTGSRTVTPATAEAEKFHTSPFFGVALETVSRANDPVKVQVSGLFTLRSLGPEVGSAPRFGAVGINTSGQLVRATSKECVSAPNWIGDCDASGTVTIRPRRDTRLSVLDFGAVGNGKTDDANAIQSALDCAMRLGTTDGSVVYLPPGDYRIKKPLVISNGCILEGAGLAYHDETSRILADEAGNFSLSHWFGIGAVGGETVYCAIALVGYATGLAMTPPRGRGDYAVLRQLALHSIPVQGMPPTTFQAPQMDGIRVMATGACIERMSVVSFRRNGIEISSNEIAPVVNASGVQIRDCRLTSNGQNGLDIGSLGNDNASTILVTNVDASSNGRDGICDNSRLGCTFVSCHTAANKHRNISCERPSSSYSVYLGCYAETDAPAVFKGPIAVVGGDMDITPDSTYWGYGPVRGGHGPSALQVLNNFSKVQLYRAVSGGIDIDKGEQTTGGILDGGISSKARGYLYEAQNSGRTGGVEPDWNTTKGSLTQDGTPNGGVPWLCLGKLEPMIVTSNILGSNADSTIIQDIQSVTMDGKLQPVDGDSLFRTQVQVSRDPDDPRIGRIETSLLSAGQPFHTYYQTAYGNGPVPGALMLPEAWIGQFDHGERRIGVVYSGNPYTTTVGSCNFYSPGDLILNAYNDATRQGPIGWAVAAACGRGSEGHCKPWVPGQHYSIGQTVKPKPPTPANGFLYRLKAYRKDGLNPRPLNPHLNVSGQSEPRWSQTVGDTTEDKCLEWQTLYDLDDPANKKYLEPLPQRVPDQTDSHALDIDHLRADFNALLVKLRAAHLLGE